MYAFLLLISGQIVARHGGWFPIAGSLGNFSLCEPLHTPTSPVDLEFRGHARNLCAVVVFPRRVPVL